MQDRAAQARGAGDLHRPAPQATPGLRPRALFHRGRNMARIAGINIPNHQHAAIALTAIYGVGRSRARLICEAAGVKHSAKVKDLTDAEMDKLRENVAKFSVEG